MDEHNFVRNYSKNEEVKRKHKQTKLLFKLDTNTSNVNK